MQHILKEWNVMPLLGYFGGRVGICSFYRALLCLWCSTLSLSPSLLSLFCSFCARLQVAGLRACPRDCNKGMHPTKGKRKERAISIVQGY